MPREVLHRFEYDGKRFAMDPESCFCFECDAISWDVLEYYPDIPVNQIYHRLGDRYDRKELAEVIGELEWLRATKSILTPPKKEELFKMYEVERGVKRLLLAWRREVPAAEQAKRRWFGPKTAPAPAGTRDVAREAVALLLARAEAQPELYLEFVADPQLRDPDFIGEMCVHALRSATLAGKKLTAAVRIDDLNVSKLPEALKGHTLGAGIEFQDAVVMLPHLRALAGAGEATLSRWAKIIQPAASGVTGRIVVRPNHAAFGGVVQELDQAGFTHIELDMNGAYVVNPNLEPRSMLEGMSQSAVYYAQELLHHRYFRLDPVATLFWRIYSGSPVRRSDPVGTNELAVDATGAIYPCWNMVGVEDLRLGSVIDGTFDEEKARGFEDVGALTTRECIVCWARNLCGGGNAAVHRAFTGSLRRPHEPWCDAQRSWMAAAVSAFQLLSSAGVHFDRIYKTLGRGEKPSLFSLARAALTLTIGVRPIQEADAEMLTKWENWNDAAYFTFTDSGVLLATKYDREMDALHPQGIEQELLLVRKDGEAFGLLKVRPELFEGIARAWIYMRNEGDYASDSIRKGFRAVLKEASGQQAIRRLLVPASAKERGLAGFLESVGFAHEGTLREAMYVHGVYHDITLYGIATDAL